MRADTERWFHLMKINDRDFSIAKRFSQRLIDPTISSYFEEHPRFLLSESPSADSFYVFGLFHSLG